MSCFFCGHWIKLGDGSSFPVAAASRGIAQPEQHSAKVSAAHSGAAEAIKLRIPGRGYAEVAVGRAISLSCVATGSDLKAAYYSSRSPNSPLIVWTLNDVPVEMLFPSHKVSSVWR